jgi:hypothetical protein
MKKNIDVEIWLTGKELADEFCNSSDVQQAEFFNEVFLITEKWKRGFAFQLHYITDNKILTDGGRKIMEQIGDYSK